MAADAQHRILRQVVELAGCRREDAAALQAAAARLSQRDWMPLMAAACSTLGDAGRVQRIDRLEVDLGTLPAMTWLAAASGAHATETTDRATAGQAATTLAQQFERAFSARLAVALQQAADVQTDTELLAGFLASGVLPWWADASDRHAVLRAARAQRRQPASAWRSWLGLDGGQAPNEPALLRLVATLPPEDLADLLADLLAQRSAQPSTGAVSDPQAVWTVAHQALWHATIDHAAAALGQPALRWHRAWWLAGLTSALWPAGGADGWSALLSPWLARLGLPEATVRPALQRALDHASARSAGAADWAPLWRALQSTDAPAQARARRADAAWQQLLAALAAAAAAPGAAGPAWRHLHQRLAQATVASGSATSLEPTGWYQAAADAWAHLASQAPVAPLAAADDAQQADMPAAGRLAALAAALARLLQHALQQGLIDPASAGLAGGAPAVQQRAADWAAAACSVPSGRSGPPGPPGPPGPSGSSGPSGPPDPSALSDQTGPSGPSSQSSPSGQPAPPVLVGPAAEAAAARAGGPAHTTAPAATTAVDALYVPQAGLVLLWPFIQRFADRLGLLQPGKPVRWRDAGAAQRAAVLLQCVISGDAAPPEFQLALPKLLCGLPLDEPLVLDEALTDAEQAECEALLVAAIAQAPILREMSVAGFRGSFGLRTGQLSSRDGHWLLRVERQAYDVVIDRFPWSAGLVRLPWMPALLQVQW